MGHNGWTNRETWLVNVWFGDDIGNGHTTWDAVKEEIEEVLIKIRDEMPCGRFFDDYINLSLINWRELKSKVEVLV